MELKNSTRLGFTRWEPSQKMVLWRMTPKPFHGEFGPAMARIHCVNKYDLKRFSILILPNFYLFYWVPYPIGWPNYRTDPITKPTPRPVSLYSGKGVGISHLGSHKHKTVEIFSGYVFGHELYANNKNYRNQIPREPKRSSLLVATSSHDSSELRNPTLCVAQKEGFIFVNVFYFPLGR